MADSNVPPAKSTSISFGFKKKVENKADDKRAFNEHQEVVDGKELLSQTDTAFFQEKKKEKDIVIPLIKKNRWLTPDDGSNAEQKTNKNEDDDSKDMMDTKEETNVSLEEAAARAIIEDSKRFLNDEMKNADEPSKEFDNLAVPLLLKNKPPEGFESDDRLDVSLRPDQASEADYEQIPIQAFGLAMLRGMGWNKSEGIGKTFKKNTQMLEAKLRPKGLGLGAENPQKQANGKKSAKSTEEEALTIRVGAYVLVCAGQHDKKYGKVEGMDADNAQCIVKFALGGSTAYISELVLQAVSKDDYVKYGKDLSRFSKAYDDKKEKEDLKRKSNGNHRHESEEKRRKSSPHDRTSLKNGHKHHKAKSSKSHDRDSHHKNSKERSSSKRRPPWVRRNLRVRIVDKNYRKGKYFREKVVIEDILDRRGSCSCRTETGKILDDLNESMLETVIPKSGSDGYVMITSHGKVEHDGKLARILEKNKAKSSAFLQLIEDRDVVVDLSFDHICEYTGDVENYSMF